MATLIDELRSTLAKMEVAMGAIQEAIFWTDALGNLQWCNSGFETITKRPRILMLGKPILSLLPLSLRNTPLPDEMHPVSQTLADKQLHYGIYELHTEDHIANLEVQCFPLLEGSGDSCIEGCVVGTVSDLSNPRVASFSRIQGVALAISANPIGILTPTGHISWVNSAWEQASGISWHELYGHPFIEAECHFEDCFGTILDNIAKGVSWSDEIDSRDEHGEGKVEIFTATPVQVASEEVVSIVVVKQDITRQRKSEEALIKSEGKLRGILEEAVDAIITTDENGTIEAINSSAAQMFGYQAKELLGSNVSILTPPEIRKNHDKYIQRYLAGGTPKIIGIGREVEALRKDGMLFPIELSISESSVGTRRFFTAIIRDISERKLWEAQQAELTERLRTKQQSIEEALASATEVQRSLLPHKIRNNSSLNIAWTFVPSEHLGGDMLGVVELNESGTELGCFIVDVAGHGVPAALVGVAVAQALQSESGIVVNNTVVSPAKVLETLDRQFPLERFNRHFTVFYGILNKTTCDFTYSSGGHPLAYCIRANGSLERMDAGGTLIGLGNIVPFEEKKIHLKRSDTLFLYTDGIVEHEKSDGEQFGENRLQQILTKQATSSCEDMLSSIYASVKSYTELPIHDDVSMLAIRLNT